MFAGTYTIRQIWKIRLNIGTILIFKFYLSQTASGLLSKLEVVSLIRHLLREAMLRQILGMRVSVKPEGALYIRIFVLLQSLIFRILVLTNVKSKLVRTWTKSLHIELHSFCLRHV